jgi:hypothetical protein
MQIVVCVLALLSSTMLLQAVTSLGPVDSWEVLIENAGISAMHMTLAHTNKVIMFDRTDFGASQIRLADGFCRRDPLDKALHVDCWAHSIELDIATKTIRALTVRTDTWCSSGRLEFSLILFQFQFYFVADRDPFGDSRFFCVNILGFYP